MVDGFKLALTYAWRLGLRSSNVQAHVLRGPLLYTFCVKLLRRYADGGPKLVVSSTISNGIT